MSTLNVKVTTTCVKILNKPINVRWNYFFCKLGYNNIDYGWEDVKQHVTITIKLQLSHCLHY